MARQSRPRETRTIRSHEGWLLNDINVHLVGNADYLHDVEFLASPLRILVHPNRVVQAWGKGKAWLTLRKDNSPIVLADSVIEEADIYIARDIEWPTLSLRLLSDRGWRISRADPAGDIQLKHLQFPDGTLFLAGRHNLRPRPGPDHREE